MAPTLLPPEEVEPENRAEWRAWLSQNHASARAVWLVLRKKTAPEPNLTWAEAVQEALCYGWIDSVGRKLDETRSRLYFTPRKRGSGWSAVNKNHIERLVAAGQMTAAGQARIDAAKADGSWTLLDSVEALEVPGDLAAALNAVPGALEQWNAFPGSAKKGILQWIVQAKTAPTRAKRITQTAELAAQSIRANTWKPRG
ncbi:YdeI family protein [Deinococcus oregonensis]|uniref:YdeI family protein n=1 Tax=Deinococcus oregonensis TaxID=1805970 RepID=A0ABV6AZL1_9DEIO